jgi:Tol biopolymer transport system component
MRIDGSDRRQLGSSTEAHDIQPAWSPDGRTIALQRTTATVSADIWLMNADGTSERPLLVAPLAGSQLSPAWSPDGRLVAFTSAHESAGGSPSYQIYTAWTDGTKLARRTFDASDKSAPVFLPVTR